MTKMSIIIAFIVTCIVIAGCSGGDSCECLKTTITYGEFNIPRESTSKVNCPTGIQENETRLTYDGFGKVTSTVTKECSGNIVAP